MKRCGANCSSFSSTEKLITPEAFARIFCDDLDLPQKWIGEVARQITEQCEEQTGVAEIPVRSHEDELNSVEKDLRVILNVSLDFFLDAYSKALFDYQLPFFELFHSARRSDWYSSLNG